MSEVSKIVGDCVRAAGFKRLGKLWVFDFGEVLLLAKMTASNHSPGFYYLDMGVVVKELLATEEKLNVFAAHLPFRPNNLSIPSIRAWNDSLDGGTPIDPAIRRENICKILQEEIIPAAERFSTAEKVYSYARWSIAWHKARQVGDAKNTSADSDAVTISTMPKPYILVFRTLYWHLMKEQGIEPQG